MSQLLGSAVFSQMTKRGDRLKQEREDCNCGNSQLAEISGFDTKTGAYKATTPDGGIVQGALGNFKNPTGLVSVSSARTSNQAFFDYKVI